VLDRPVLSLAPSVRSFGEVELGSSSGPYTLVTPPVRLLVNRSSARRSSGYTTDRT
jgi:hypothetical protein